MEREGERKNQRMEEKVRTNAIDCLQFVLSERERSVVAQQTEAQ